MDDLHKLIRKIQIQTTHLAKETLAGSYHSAFKGKGIEFEEVRPYINGDDLRSIDWKVTARMNQPYVKNFREERELSVLLAVDISPSTQFGSGEELKSQRMAEIGGVLAFSAIQNNDKIGLILYSDKVEHYLPPRKGTRHILRLIRELLTWQPSPQKKEQSLLSFLGNTTNHHSICFLITDLFSSYDPKQLSIIAKKYDLISLLLTDQRELELPNMGYLALKDLKTDEVILTNSSSEKNRSSYRKQRLALLEEKKKAFLKAGAGFISLSTDTPYVPPINQFFMRRKRK